MDKEHLTMSNPKDKFTKETDTRFTLRIDTEIYNKVKQQAEKNRRSAAKEIEFILAQWLENNGK